MSRLVQISGSKNSALPIIAATALTKGVYTLSNIPSISDVIEQLSILQQLNVKVTKLDGNRLLVDTSNLSPISSLEYNAKIRGSYYFMGSLAYLKMSRAYEYPGGCNIGSRPIDYHIDFFEAIGIKVNNLIDRVELDSSPMHSNDVVYTFGKPSVGATINAILSTVINDGCRTVKLVNAARDPYIVDLCNFLRKMGAKVAGDGTSQVTVESVRSLCACNHEVIPDPIEAGSYIILSAILTLQDKFDFTIGPIILDHLGSFRNTIGEIGIDLKRVSDGYYRVAVGKHFNSFSAITEPFPGLYTDLHPFLTLIANYCSNRCEIVEEVMDSRFQYIGEMKKIYPNLHQVGNRIIIDPPGADMERIDYLILNVLDLRSGAALLFASIVNHRRIVKVVFNNFGIIERGYEDITGKIKLIDYRNTSLHTA
jgi:UDP-N-acetylglucosamine 1-carboxyvinyltransferase